MSSTESQPTIEMNPIHDFINIRKQLTEEFKGSAPNDVHFKAKDGGFIHAHKSMLSTHSKYFENIFCGEFKDYEQNVVYIKELNYLILKELIGYMYTGEMPEITMINADEMLYGAQLFVLDDVRDECIDFLMSSINDQNCLVIKNIAEVRELNCLADKSMKHAIQNFDSVSRFQEFLDANLEDVSELIENEFLVVEREEHVYEAAMQWIKYDLDNRKEFLPELLRKVKLEYMQNYYLFEILKEPLIEENEKCTKMINETCQNNKLKYGNAIFTLTTASSSGNQQVGRSKKPRLTRVTSTNQKSPCYGEKAFNIISTLDENIAEEFQDIEWVHAMDESNFLSEWGKTWKDLKD